MDMQNEEFPIEESTWSLSNDCRRIAEDLVKEGISEHVEHLVVVAEVEIDFSLLAKTIQENIEQNEPGIALD